MSIQALADSLGLSISTVSRALNGYSDVSAKTRSRVEAAAKALNYHPDPMAHRLATGRTGAVALVFTARAGNRQEATLAALMSGLFTLAVGLPVGEDELPELARPATLDGRVALLQKRGVPRLSGSQPPAPLCA